MIALQETAPGVTRMVCLDCLSITYGDRCAGCFLTPPQDQPRND